MRLRLFTILGIVTVLFQGQTGKTEVPYNPWHVDIFAPFQIHPPPSNIHRSASHIPRSMV